MKEAKNDPIKKADLIRDMVISISKIPDRIKREIYIQECSRIMDISEEVLFNTLAQLDKKELTEANKQYKQEQKTFDVVRNEQNINAAKVNVQEQLERKIIEILLFYGFTMQEFEDVLLKADESGEVVEVKEKVNVKVYQRIFLSLQEDEIELANPVFKSIYTEIIDYFNLNEEFEIGQFLNQLPPEITQEVTSILMNEEREVLHNWEVKHIIVKQKETTVAQYVSETILSLRWYWVNKIIEELKQSIVVETTAEDNAVPKDNSETLATIMDYLGLSNLFSKRLGRVLSSYH
jgi:DNA primase